jgi:hypothetical protein
MTIISGAHHKGSLRITSDLPLNPLQLQSTLSDLLAL